ncbi:short-chain dehydrogenase [Apiospora saccharicola]
MSSSTKVASNDEIYTSITKAFHKEPYPSISPQRPELSHAGKSVLVTGGGGGIGFHIAKAFLQASAATVIIVGRRLDFINKAAAQLGQEFPDSKVLGLQCDVASSADVDRVWADLRKRGVAVDVLVLNATIVPPPKPLLELGAESLRDNFNVNVIGNLDMTQHFYKQDESRATKSLVYVSTVAAHNFKTAGVMPAYGLTKNAGTLAMQLIAKDTPREAMQIVSFNPGPVWTPAAESAGPTFRASSPSGAPPPEAAFLHGRFVWTEWDVDEMKSGDLRKKIDETPTYLQIGIHGV